MKELAVVVLGRRGKELARSLKEGLPFPVKVCLPRRLAEGEEAYDSLGELLADLFPKAQGIIWVGAVGAAVRLLAPLLRDKISDPPVVVVDEGGRFAVSLLGGHRGANELAEKVAGVLGAVPVITTASDSLGVTSWDVFARRHDLAFYPREHLARATRALLEGEEVWLYWDEDLPRLPLPWPPSVKVYPWRPGTTFPQKYPLTVWVSARILPEPPPFLVLCPRKLVAGVGCRRGVKAEQVMLALEETVKEAGFSLLALKALATVTLKQGEKGLEEAAASMGLKLRYFSTEELAEVEKSWPDPLPASAFVKEKVGVGNVCTASALAAGGRRLLVPKRVFPAVTVALAELDWP
ncbi:cobalt-precorrin 5A hydrolase [Ammonifex thiophilus]|uniref:Cobalamin biosynthesis protein CbiG n=1 Tax=Ammonifex thiophilus TaxID=444093 RepID=A0A3D8P3W7_9THEO|nr:cobalt-precorrin 5A hydrolase [Ammonifex thiophilus]RDV83628.1 cobalamin biosynthesis protein CbiG [Ammonifex thiophilus]